MDSEILVGLLKLILINIVLSGDNAVVIALACRNLPAHQQKKAILWGSGGAIGLRIILTVVAVWLLQIPFVQLAGALLLIYIAVKLLKSEDNEEHIKSSSKLGAAIQTIIVADLVMSLDNVLAVAGAANGNLWLIGVGLAISIPLIVWGSQLLMSLMNRFPVIVLIGAGLLGYTAGEMAVTDKAIGAFIDSTFHAGHRIIPIVLALLVICTGKILSKKKADGQEPEMKSAV
jgi:YjbE family integral membrane protein